MPSIRETLKEMGVTPAEMSAALAPKLDASRSLHNGTAPTPLTNYLDVSAKAVIYIYFLSSFFFFFYKQRNLN